MMGTVSRLRRLLATEFWCKPARLVLVLIASSFVTSPGLAQVSSDWNVAKKNAFQLAASGDCDGGWNIMWLWANRGEIDARRSLLWAAMLGGLAPPGFSQDPFAQMTYMFVLLVYAGPYDMEWLEQNAPYVDLAPWDDHDLLPDTLRSFATKHGLFARMGGRELAACLDRNIDPDICIDEAVASGFVPDFATYAAEIDSLVDAGAMPAVCIESRAFPE